MPTEPLTDTEIAELYEEVDSGELYGEPVNKVRRLLDEVKATRAGAVTLRFEEDGKTVPFSSVLLESVAKLQSEKDRARAVLEELPPVARGDHVQIPRELYDRLRALLGQTKSAASPKADGA